jgi:aryl-alcohol dehydrogenase-like predicted oxidoreductase
LFGGDPNGGGAGRKSIVNACEHSLRRLQTDYIDLYWMHCWDRLTPVEETMRALDHLVTSGKVRYIGFSDTPAWKVSQAQTIAQLRGWAPLVALQIEYSLLERTVEGELMPMAREMGLGVTPWSPLKSGVLSGKYTRENAASVKADRGERVTQNLGEKVYSIIDELIAIGKELGASPASVALAWVQGRPGVASTIIGARRLDQLDQNLAALALSMNADQVARLDKLSKPTLGFPMQFLNVASIFSQGGTTVNGEASTVWPLAPKSDAERY